MNNDSHDTSARKLRVFLCHASEDKPVVRDIYQKLVDYNIEPWLDEKNLLPGEHWEQLIPDVIRKCDIILLCLSRTFQVKEGYGQYEVHVILEAAKRKPQDTIFLIPFRLDDCEVPSYLNGIHYASHFIPEDFDKLIAACKKRREWLNTIHWMNIESIEKSSQATLLPPRSVSEQIPPQPVPPDKETHETNSPGSVVSAYNTLDRTIKVEHFNFTTSLNPVNVFLSYVHEDEELLRQLEAHLSMLKREGLIATWCDRQIMPGADWAGVIDQHLEQASLILLLVSADFLASDYCYQIEVKRALELHQAGRAVVIPIIIRSADWKNAPFAQLQALPTGAKAITDWSNQDNAFVDVVAGIREVVEKLANRSSDPPYGGRALRKSESSVSRPADERKSGETSNVVLQEDPFNQHPQIASQPDPANTGPIDQHPVIRFGAPFPDVWNVPRRHNAFFTGRDAVLQQLADGFLQIEKSQGTMLPQAITGLAGMGKTQAAAEYAYRFREKYRAVLWVHAERKESLLLDFQTIASLLKLPQEHAEDQDTLIQTVQKWFRRESGWLLVFDNADDFALVAHFIPVGLGHILLTTRAGSTVELAESIELSKLTEEDGALCLLRRAGILRSYQSLANASPAHADAARALALQMKGLPLALEQAGAYINDTKCGVIQYRQRYEHYRARLQNIKSGTIPDYALPVAPALMMSSLMIGRPSMAFALLQLCAFLAPEGIPDEFIMQAAPELGELLSPVADDPLLLDQAIKSLVRYSLLEREEQSGMAFTMLSIHRVLQLVLLDEMDKDRPTLQLWAERTVRALLLARKTELWPVLQSHVQQCLEHIAHWKLSVPGAEDLQA
jgi:TIR domain/AAA domain